jgi:hypothetical protein
MLFINKGSRPKSRGKGGILFAYSTEYEGTGKTRIQASVANISGGVDAYPRVRNDA